MNRLHHSLGVISRDIYWYVSVQITNNSRLFSRILQFGDTQRHVFIEEKRNESSTHCPNPRVCDHANGPVAEEALATQPRGLVGRPAPRAT